MKLFYKNFIKIPIVDKVNHIKIFTKLRVFIKNPTFIKRQNFIKVSDSIKFRVFI